VRALSILLLAFGALGCSQSEAFLSSRGLASMLLIDMQGQIATVTAYDLAGDTIVRQPAPETGELFVVGLASPLDALDLAPGKVEVTAAGRPLPSGSYHQLDGGGWTELAELPVAARALQLAYIDRCARFVSTDRVLSRRGLEIPTFALPLDPEHVMIGHTDGVFTVVTTTAVTVHAEYGAPYGGGSVRGEELWLVGPGTRVQHGHPSRGFVDAPPLPFAISGNRAQVATSPPETALEVFVTDSSLAVAYFDGTSWRTIRAATPIEEGSDRREGIAWMAPGLAAFIGDSNDSVTELGASGFQRAVHLDLPLRGTADTLFSVRYITEVGVVLASRYSVTFRRIDGHWERLALARVTPSAIAIVDLGGSFIVGGQDGVFFEYREGDVLCAPIAGLGYERADAAARLGSGVVTLGPREEGEFVLVTSARVAR